MLFRRAKEEIEAIEGQDIACSNAQSSMRFSFALTPSIFGSSPLRKKERAGGCVPALLRQTICNVSARTALGGLIRSRVLPISRA
jgi:hypothetical protein